MKITSQAAEALINKGTPFLEATYVNGQYDVIKAGQKGTEAKKEMPCIKHLLNRGSNAYLLTEFLPEGTKEDAVKLTFKPGQVILVELYGYERDGAGFNIRGTMTAITVAPTK